MRKSVNRANLVHRQYAKKLWPYCVNRKFSVNSSVEIERNNQIIDIEIVRNCRKFFFYVYLHTKFSYLMDFPPNKMGVHLKFLIFVPQTFSLICFQHVTLKANVLFNMVNPDLFQ
jgi:hypothetical protein